MPHSHDEDHDTRSYIEVFAARPNNAPSADGGSGGFHHFGGRHDAFHFTSPLSSNGPDQAPGRQGSGIVVTGDRPTDPFPLDNRAFMDAIRTLLDNLDAFDFGDYRLNLGVGVAELQIFNHWDGTIDTYTLTTNGGTVSSEEDPSPEVFDLPPGFKPSGPQFDLGYDYDYL